MRAYVLQAILPYNIKENLQTSEADISKTFDLNDIKFSRVVKMPFCITFEKFGSVAPNLRSIVFHDAI